MKLVKIYFFPARDDARVMVTASRWGQGGGLGQLTLGSAELAPGLCSARLGLGVVVSVRSVGGPGGLVCVCVCVASLPTFLNSVPLDWPCPLPHCPWRLQRWLTQNKTSFTFGSKTADPYNIFIFKKIYEEKQLTKIFYFLKIFFLQYINFAQAIIISLKKKHFTAIRGLRHPVGQRTKHGRVVTRPAHFRFERTYTRDGDAISRFTGR